MIQSWIILIQSVIITDDWWWCISRSVSVLSHLLLSEYCSIVFSSLYPSSCILLHATQSCSCILHCVFCLLRCSQHLSDLYLALPHPLLSINLSALLQTLPVILLWVGLVSILYRFIVGVNRTPVRRCRRGQLSSGNSRHSDGVLVVGAIIITLIAFTRTLVKHRTRCSSAVRSTSRKVRALIQDHSHGRTTKIRHGDWIEIN
jgi:hypothetical protein